MIIRNRSWEFRNVWEWARVWKNMFLNPSRRRGHWTCRELQRLGKKKFFANFAYVGAESRMWSYWIFGIKSLITSCTQGYGSHTQCFAEPIIFKWEIKDSIWPLQFGLWHLIGYLIHYNPKFQCILPVPQFKPFKSLSIRDLTKLIGVDRFLSFQVNCSTHFFVNEFSLGYDSSPIYLIGRFNLFARSVVTLFLCPKTNLIVKLHLRIRI